LSKCKFVNIKSETFLCFLLVGMQGTRHVNQTLAAQQEKCFSFVFSYLSYS
jgi:hypothetical protein